MGQLKVRDIMTTDVVTISPNDTVREATIRFSLESITGAPVVDDNYKMVGVISVNDILDLIMDYDRRYKGGSQILSYYLDADVDDPELKKMADEISSIKVSDIMTRTILSTSPGASVIDLLRSMTKMDVSRVPVLEKGVLLGIASRTDIITSMYKKKVR